MKIKLYIARKLFELGIKLVLRYQNIALVSGITLYQYYRNPPKFLRSWKGYSCEMMHNMDAYLVIKKGGGK